MENKMDNGAVTESFNAFPLLLEENSIPVFLRTMQRLKTNPNFQNLTIDSPGLIIDDDFWSESESEQSDFLKRDYRPYKVKNGILSIPVDGILLANMGYAIAGFATGYTYIDKAIDRGIDDAEVNGIALIINSPGGHVFGNFELSNKIYNLRDRKPIRAYVKYNALSAAYSIASAALSITGEKSAQVGSIGVVMTHVSLAEALRTEGIEFTSIFKGKHKIDGNPYNRLPDAVKERYQQQIDDIYEEFTGIVARNLNIDQKDVANTEAMIYSNQRSIKLGLLDKEGVVSDEVAMFAEAMTGNQSMKKNSDVKSPKIPEGNSDQEQVVAADRQASQEQIVAADRQASQEQVVADNEQAFYHQGQAAATERQNAILDSVEAKNNPAMAIKILKTSMNADEAIRFMQEMASEVKTTEASWKQDCDPGRNHFAEAMNSSDNPDVGAAESKSDESTGKRDINALLNSYNAICNNPPLESKR